MKINIVWLKRDVRWHDHAVLRYAIDDRLPVILLYLFEPSVMGVPESDIRHFRFAYQGLLDFTQKLGSQKATILHAEAIDVYDSLKDQFEIQQVLSHQETGLEVTYRRDQAVRRWCRSNGVQWKTFGRDGVQRNLKDRTNWQDYWDSYMNAPLIDIDPRQLTIVSPEPYIFRKEWLNVPKPIKALNQNFQNGGESEALSLLSSFTKERAKDYLKNLARPAHSQDTCSRLSPYIAHGQISARKVFQATQEVKQVLGKNIDQFHNRLWWRCHYIQKLETEYQIEKHPINRGFLALKKPYRADYYHAWSTGSTGFPMIDASMRCLIDTGYLNFRMRAMLATFWSFTLWQDWQIGATHLAKVFLDFEPGIHYPQFQMQ
ncbi:MAG: FAD-binding domain-containing protein, partial [Bacteroidota bacterium]